MGGFLYDIIMAPNASAQRTMAFVCDQAYNGDHYDCLEEMDTQCRTLKEYKLPTEQLQANVRVRTLPYEQYDSFRDISDSLQSVMSDEAMEPYDRMHCV